MDWDMGDSEKHIMNGWGIKNTIQWWVYRKSKKVPLDSPLEWCLPPEGHFKVNFDGASKGNPGSARFGGVIKNPKGNIVQFYHGFIVHDMNNIDEMEGLLYGL